MAKLCELLDELPELDKRVYALKLLDAVDIFSLTPQELNLWIGLFHDSFDLLEQTAFDLRTLAANLSNS